MKILPTILTILTLAASAGLSEENHEHKPVPGPKGGKILEMGRIHSEFLIRPDRKVSIAFYDEGMQPVAPGEQVAKVIAEAPSGKVTLDFERTNDVLVSTTVLPEGSGYRIVVQIRETASAKSQNFRIEYHAEVCGECNLPEYACVCSGHAGHGH